MNNSTSIFFVLLLLLSNGLWSQTLQTDTVDYTGNFEKITFTESVDFPEWEQVDTLLDNYHYFNPAEEDWGRYLWLGNLGQAHYNLLFNYERNSAFDLGFNQFNAYRFSSESVPHFFCKAPYTKLRYVLGYNTEQRLDVIHTQNIKRYLNFSVNMRRLPSDGMYDSSRSSGSALSAQLWYKPANRRYSNLFSFTWNKNEVEQNGGVKDNTLFSTNLFRRDLANVWLNSAKRTEITRSYEMNQYWNGGHYKTVELEDSLRLKELETSWRLQLKSSIDQGRYYYNDDAVSEQFYGNVFLDSTATADTLRTWTIRNEAAVLWLGRNPFALDTTDNGMRFRGGIGNEIIHLRNVVNYGAWDFESTRQLSNTYFFAQFFRQEKDDPSFRYSAKYRLVLSGYQSGDQELQLAAALKLPFARIGGALELTNLKPSYLHHEQIGNHRSWSNTWDREQANRIQIHFSDLSQRFRLELNQFAITNYSYFNEEVLPAQLSDRLLISQLRFASYFQLGRFHFKQQLNYQRSNSDAVPLSAFVGQLDWFYRSTGFNHALEFQTGVIGKYWSNFTAPDFAPSIQQFYLQTTKQLKFYPIMDLYLSLKIRKARIFLRTENLNQGLPFGENGYFVSPYTPMPDRALKFGVDWIFVD